MKTIEEQIAEGQAVKQMMASSEGWRVVKNLILEMQEKAFTDWGELDFDAKPERVAELKFTKRILSKLMNEINLVVELGTEAIVQKELEKENSIREAMFVAEKSSDSELERLNKPLSFFDRFRREPVGASDSNGPQG